jgi:hypothetical protein
LIESSYANLTYLRGGINLLVSVIETSQAGEFSMVLLVIIKIRFLVLPYCRLSVQKGKMNSQIRQEAIGQKYNGT